MKGAADISDFFDQAIGIGNATGLAEETDSPLMPGIGNPDHDIGLPPSDSFGEATMPIAVPGG